jgi:hypothetical protein
LFQRTFATRLLALVLAIPCVSHTSSAAPDGKMTPADDIQASSLPASSVRQDNSRGQQSKRILGIIPNYKAVSADTKLPPLSRKGKFVLATQDSFDYSSLLVAGFTAGLAQARDSYPEFRQGSAGFGRYYWHSFADQALGNYLTEFIVPSLTQEDPRYYTRFHGGLLPRTGYAFNRLFIIRRDSGGQTFNFSEIVGNGAGAAISNLYYPRRERTWTKTGQKWANQVALDGVFNFLKEFWPDIRHDILRQK